MLRGGDIRNSAETLKSLLRRMKYSTSLSFEDIAANNPCIFLQIAHYVLVDYSPSYYKSKPSPLAYR